jgi:endonuclease VIII
MPEGPVIRLLSEKAQVFVGKKVKKASAIDNALKLKQLEGQKVKEIKTFGKQLLITLEDISVSVHLMLFGYYLINEKKPNGKLRLGLEFDNGELNFYASQVKLIEEPLEDVYDWSVDVMSDSWNAEAAVEKMNDLKKLLICDALLDQDIFAGVGNKIKDEILFNAKVHPASAIEKVPEKKKKELAQEAASFSFKYLDWKRTEVQDEHFKVHWKEVCPRDGTPIEKPKMGKQGRTTYHCPKCQVKYG